MTSRTYDWTGSMTATMCELCGPVDPPAYRTFFELSPVGKNHKTISVKISGKVMHWRFEWLHDHATYVKMWMNDSPEERYIGTFDYNKNIVNEAPASVSKTSEYFILTNIMLDKFIKNNLKYLYNALS